MSGLVYHRRPEPVEAVQFLDSWSSRDALREWIGENRFGRNPGYFRFHLVFGKHAAFSFPSSTAGVTGLVTAMPGDWVVKGADGIFSCVREDDFDRDYVKDVD